MLQTFLADLQCDRYEGSCELAQGMVTSDCGVLRPHYQSALKISAPQSDLIVIPRVGLLSPQTTWKPCQSSAYHSSTEFISINGMKRSFRLEFVRTSYIIFAFVTHLGG